MATVQVNRTEAKPAQTKVTALIDGEMQNNYIGVSIFANEPPRAYTGSTSLPCVATVESIPAVPAKIESVVLTMSENDARWVMYAVEKACPSHGLVATLRRALTDEPVRDHQKGTLP